MGFELVKIKEHLSKVLVQDVLLNLMKMSIVLSIHKKQIPLGLIFVLFCRKQGRVYYVIIE